MKDINILKGIDELQLMYGERQPIETFEETLEELLDELELNSEDYEGKDINLSFGEFDESMIVDCYEDILYY